MTGGAGIPCTAGATAAGGVAAPTSPALSMMSLKIISEQARYSLRPAMPLPWHSSPATFADVWAMMALSLLLICIAPSLSGCCYQFAGLEPTPRYFPRQLAQLGHQSSLHFQPS